MDKQHYPHLNVRFVFRSSTRTSSFFPFKDKVPKFLISGVVYLLKCRCCSASYVGQTTRHLHTRVSEHVGISPLTGKPSSNPPMSSIFSHLKTTGHTASFDDFQILSSCWDDCELMIHESLLILKLKPTRVIVLAILVSSYPSSVCPVMYLPVSFYPLHA